MINSADQGGCYLQRPKAELDNTLRGLLNSSYANRVEFNNCFIIHSKYFPVLKRVLPFRSLFLHSPKITQSGPQVFGLIICSGWYFQYDEDSFQIWSIAAAYGGLCVWF